MDLGAGRRGVDMGPSALRLAQLGDRLRSLGHEVRDLGNVDVPVAEAAEAGAAHARYQSAIAGVCQSLAATLAAIPGDHIPVVLGGDHALSLGSVAGSIRRSRDPQRLGLLWIDAHADLNTPEDSPSGNVHGMPLAHLLGEGAAELRAVASNAMAPENVVLLGLRSVDPGERERIRRLGIRAFTISDIDRFGIAAVLDQALKALAHTERLHLSFDADVLDPAVAPGIGTPVRGGLSYREAHLLMELLSEHGQLAAVDFVEVNPILDQGNRTANMIVELAESLFGRSIL
jgi:arginase